MASRQNLIKVLKESYKAGVLTTTAAKEIELMDKRITELEAENERLKAQVNPLSFEQYETIADINNHNYARYEALIEDGHIVKPRGE